MPTYVAFLRGINVSGKNKIKMNQLRECFLQHDCEQVQTYLLSGNVIFAHANPEPALLEKQISQWIQTSFGFDIEVCVKETSAIQWIATHNPFLNKVDGEAALKILHVTLLLEVPSDLALDKLSEVACDPEEWEQFDKIVYLHMPNGYGRGKMQNNLLERKLKVSATTRNWKTMLAINDLIFPAS